MRIIGLILLLFVIESVSEILYRRTTKYISTLGGTDKFRKVPKGIEICNIGSGPGLYGISYDKCKRKGFNFSTAPQDFYYGYQLLKHFSNNIKKNAIVLIVIMCPMSFGNNKSIKEKDYSDKFYGVLCPNEIRDYSVYRALLLKHIFVTKCIRKLKSKMFFTKAIKANAACKSVVQVWEEEFEIDNLKDVSTIENHLMAMEEKKKLIKDEIDFIRENGWRPVILIPPIPSVTREKIGEDFKKLFFENNLIEIVKCKDVKVMNFYDSDFFDESCFLNDIFLNNDGRDVLSKLIFEELL